MYTRIKSLSLMSLLVLAAAGPSPAEAAPSGGPQGDTSFNAADMYYDYQVIVWDDIGGGWFVWGTYDTYDYARFVGDVLILVGYEDVSIVRVRVFPLWLSPYRN
jgi:hypothetical protein